METQPEENHKENPTFVATLPVGPQQVKMTCPHCKALVTTGMGYVSTTNTHILCAVFSLIGCFLCAPCVYCNDDCKAVEHYCPNCFKYLGKYNP